MARVTPQEMKILTAYTGAVSLEKALEDPRAARLLWLEILVNDELDLGSCRENPLVDSAYTKACLWYTTYRRTIDSFLKRKPLPAVHGRVDERELRIFLEAMRFAASHA